MWGYLFIVATKRGVTKNGAIHLQHDNASSTMRAIHKNLNNVHRVHFMPRLIANKTYKQFAKKYNIKIGKKSILQLSKEIYYFEKHCPFIKKGLYFV
jgi:hypothetical protein